jgi:hypothetical protein
MVSQVRIQRPAVPDYDPVSGYAVGVKADVPGYEGKAHVHPVTSAGTVYTGDTLTALMSVQVSLPYNATPVPREEDQVVIVADDDPALVGKTLRITDVGSGGIGRPVRLLTCTFVEDNPFNPDA